MCQCVLATKPKPGKQIKSQNWEPKQLIIYSAPAATQKKKSATIQVHPSKKNGM